MRHALATLALSLAAIGAIVATRQVLTDAAEQVGGPARSEPPAQGFHAREQAIRDQRDAAAVLVPQSAAFDTSYGKNVDDGPIRLQIAGQ